MTLPGFATCRDFRVLYVSLLASAFEAAWSVVAQLGADSNLLHAFVHFYTSCFIFQPIARVTRTTCSTDILLAFVFATTIVYFTASTAVASLWSLVFTTRAVFIPITNLFKSKARPFDPTAAFTLSSAWILALKLITFVVALSISRTTGCARNALAIVASELVSFASGLTMISFLVTSIRTVAVTITKPCLVDTVVAIPAPPLPLPTGAGDVQARKRLRSFRTSFLVLSTTAI